MQATVGLSATTSQLASVDTDMQNVLILALVCFVFDFLGMFGGFSIFFKSVSETAAAALRAANEPASQPARWRRPRAAV